MQFALARKVEERDRIKGLLFERRYKQIVEARLGHIPARLPFPKPAIMERLKANDRSSPNWPSQDKLADLEAEMALVNKEISSAIPSNERETTPKQRRLKAIWGFLTLSAERYRYITSQRLGRLKFNIGLFSRSDLPASYIVDIGESTHWELAALTIAANAEAERLIGRISGQSADRVERDVFMQSKESLQAIEKAYREYARGLRKVTIVSDRVLEWRDAAEYYVDLFSAADLTAFREPREISVAGLDSNVLSHLSTGLRGAVSELRVVVSTTYPSELGRFEWFSDDDMFLTGLVQLELEAA